MDKYTKEELEAAIQSIASMIARSESAQQKFARGTSQYSLQKNRINALHVTSALVTQELTAKNIADKYTKEDLEKACAPIASLISKSEKARNKLIPGAWQHAMLTQNLKALYIAFRLLAAALNSIQIKKPIKNKGNYVMNAGQKQFFNFIMERTQADKKEEMRALLEEGFARQDNGTFTPGYMEEYTPKMLGNLKSEHVEEVKAITEQFGQNKTQ